MLANACRTRASSPSTSALVAGSMPRIPATNTKSPARAPRLHGPVGAMAPDGDRIFARSRLIMAARGSAFRQTGLQGQRVERATHLAFQRVVDELMLLHPRLAAKRFCDDRRRVMVAITGKIADRHL